MFGIPLIVVAIVVIVIAIILVGVIFASNYVKVPPNQVAVFTGRGRPVTVRGGARFRVPIIERVDMMELTPFNVEVSIKDVYSSDSVPVDVTAVGLIRFGSTDEALATAVERFLTSDRDGLQTQVREILAGSLRNIVSQLTVEALNNSRDLLTQRVLEEAASAFGPIGMQLDVLVIQSVSDKVEYILSLGQKRTAEVKSAAAIGKAEAERDASIRSAQATQAGEIAKAVAAQAIADAKRELDLRNAEIAEEVDAANARAAQAGPLAAAEAQRAVVLAGVQTEREQTEAQIAVEQQRVARSRQANQADVVIPAEAAREASVLRAQGERDATVFAAEADAKQRELRGAAEAQARTVAADALRAEGDAQASVEEARLKAQAAGQRELAEALKLMDAATVRAQILPQLIAILPQLAKELAAPMGNVDKVVIVDGGGSEGGNALTRFANGSTAALPKIMEMLGAFGIDLPGLLGSASDSNTTDGVTSIGSELTTSQARSDQPTG